MLMNETMNNNKSNDYCPQVLFEIPVESDAKHPVEYLLTNNYRRTRQVSS